MRFIYLLTFISDSWFVFFSVILYLFLVAASWTSYVTEVRSTKWLISAVLLGCYGSEERAGWDYMRPIVHLPFEQIVCLAASLISLSLSHLHFLWRFVCPCVFPGNIGDKSAPLQINGHRHDNHATSWNGMMSIMATVASGQTDSPAPPQGRADVWTRGFDTREWVPVCVSVHWQQLS